MRDKGLFFWLLLLGILLFEICFELTPQLGYFLYATFILAIIYVYSKANSDNEDYKLLILLIILPLLRISEGFIDVDHFTKTILFYVAFGVFTAFYLFKFNIQVRSSKKGYIYLPFIILLGLAIGTIISKISGIEGNLNLIYLLPIIAITEELFFRGMIQNTVRDIYSVSTSIFSSSLLYFIFSLSLGHIAIFLFLCSIISSWLYEKTENIYLSIFLNFSIHLMIFVV